MDVRIPKRMHVYAPGVADDYIPIAFATQPSPAFQADPVSYPSAMNLRLPVIHATVPVYQGSFRLVETITLAKRLSTSNHCSTRIEI